MDEKTLTIDKDTTVDEMLGHLITSTQKDGTTNAQGEFKFSDLPVGYYILEELDGAPGHKKMDPAVISIPYSVTEGGLNYDVHVYPKNVKDAPIDKEIVDKDPQYQVGDAIQWKIETKLYTEKDGKIYQLRSDDGTKYGSLVINDTLDRRLDFVSAKMYAIGGTNSPKRLVEGADYVQTRTDLTDAEGYAYTQLSWTISDHAAIDKLMDEKATGLRILIDTEVNKYALDGADPEAGIPNDADMEFENHDGTEGDFVISDDDKPVANLAILDILKIDGHNKDDNGNPLKLAGARFKIAKTKADAKAGRYIQKDLPNGSKVDIEVTTNDAGWAAFNALPFTEKQDNTYYLVETRAPEGYLKRGEIIEVTVPYDAATDVLKAVVDIENQKIGDPPIEQDRPFFQLPNTGGIGTVIFIVVGIVLITTAVVLLVHNKRKNEENTYRSQNR